jgi:hypothetical protein
LSKTSKFIKNKNLKKKKHNSYNAFQINHLQMKDETLRQFDGIEEGLSNQVE